MNTTISQEPTATATHCAPYAPPVIDYTITLDGSKRVILDFKPLTLGRLVELRDNVCIASWHCSAREWDRIVQAIELELGEMFFPSVSARMSGRSNFGVSSTSSGDTTIRIDLKLECDHEKLIGAVREHLHNVANLRGVIL